MDRRHGWGCITTGPISWQVLAADRMGAPLGAEGERFIVKARCVAAVEGLGARFLADSLRSGFVTEAGPRDMPVGEAMAMTGHRTVATFQGYYQSAAIRRSTITQACELPVQRYVVQRLFHGQVDQAEPLLKLVSAQHGLDGEW